MASPYSCLLPTRTLIAPGVAKFCGALLACTVGVASAQSPQPEERERVTDEEVVVTATKLPRGTHDIAGTVTVIDSDDIVKQQLDDLDGLVNYLPGVSMNTAARGGNQGFIIRGIGGNRVQTVIDGVRANDIYDAVTSGYGRDLFEVDDLQAVEIIHGPASVLYGADAMGGVVLLRTKNPEDYLHGNGNHFFSVRGLSNGANEHYKAGFSGGWVGEQWQAMAQYTQRQFAERDVNGSGELNPQDGDARNLLLKTLWRPLDSHRLMFTAERQEKDVVTNLESELSGTVQTSRGRDDSERQRFSIHHLWRSDMALADSVETQLYWQRNDALQHTDQVRTSYAFINPADFTTYGGTDALRRTDFEFNQELRGIDLTVLKTFATGPLQHASVYGMHFDQAETERPRNRCDQALNSGAVSCAIPAYPFAAPEVFPNKTFPDTTTKRSAIYWQNEITLADSGWVITPGVRYERYQMDPAVDGLLDVSSYGYNVVAADESELSLSVGSLYSLSDSISLFIQYAEGFRPPNYDESNQAFVNLGFGYATVPNPDLGPEYSKGVEAGIKAQWQNTQLQFAVYNNRYRDFIESAFVGMSGGISLFQDRNIGEARIRGAELSAQWRAGNHWRFSASGAYARGDNQTDDTPLDSVEPLTAVLSAAYSGANDRWGVESFLTWADNKDRVSAADRVTADSYSVLDVVAFLNISERFSLRAGVFNVFDERYARWANISGLPAANADDIANSQETGTHVKLSFHYQL